MSTPGTRGARGRAELLGNLLALIALLAAGIVWPGADVPPGAAATAPALQLAAADRPGTP